MATGPATQLFLDQPRVEPARREQRVAVEPEIGQLLHEPLIRLTGAGERGFEPSSPTFAGGERRIVQERRRRTSPPAAAARAL